jgi:hypothetical protein
VGDREQQSTFDTESAYGLDGKSEPLLRELAAKVMDSGLVLSMNYLFWDRFKEELKSRARIVFGKDSEHVHHFS